MKMRTLFASLALAISANAFADLKPWTDYDVAGELSNVTTVKVDANMIDKYLEGLRDTWITGSEAAKAVGQIKDYEIYVSQLPNSGHFNVVLVTTFESAADLQPSMENYNAFMKQWGEENEKRTEKIVQTYPEIREITGEYLMRKITIK